MLVAADSIPRKSVRAVTAAAGEVRNSVYRTLQSEAFHPYHLQTEQTLLPTDNFERVRFTRWYFNQCSQVTECETQHVGST